MNSKFRRFANIVLFTITATWHSGVLAGPAADNRDRSFDFGWRFLRADAPGAEAPAFDDSTWRALDVPHDWSIEDLTPLLRKLSDEHGCVDIRAHADQAKRPIIERHRHPRAGDSLVTALKEAPLLVDELTAAATAKVMPKGRNFH
jgi:hypothetical protein